MQKLHEPTDFKIATVFQGSVNHNKFVIVNIFHKKYTTLTGKIRYKKETTIAFRCLKTGKTYTTDIETLCRCDIKILKED